ncbi:Nicotinate-nucleotide--dimethylbenzimidazole phosphoribosyltransferase [hydrothermal vent metagenome]|uniref:Nicotinate-nucleotide--dimethylbenzimidazole phosphoribosyltransferase n=1 Tax=hydrothermal vent metagenome TaxID=652676 RepID=A0A3B1E910_9ZZZZ
MIKNITGQKDFIENLRGKKATFLLALSNTNTANIKGITQAGIPNMIHLTPTLDSEFVCTGEVRSLNNIAKTPKGVPTPALITRAIHLLLPYANIELLDLGLQIRPKLNYFKIHRFKINSSDSIHTNANINAHDIFQKGIEFGKNYTCKNDYIILGESVPSGTTTANATALALGYDCQNKFSSSFKNTPDKIKQDTIKQALNNINNDDDIFDILSKVSDNMLIFNAGFILGVNNKIPIILAGGTQMACVLLVVNKILKVMDGKIDSSNLSLCTTQWVVNDVNSNIKDLINMCDFKINSYYSNFNFSTTKYPALKLYDDGEAKEGVGAGGSLIYGLLNGLTQELITKKVESLLKE